MDVPFKFGHLESFNPSNLSGESKSLKKDLLKGICIVYTLKIYRHID